LRADSATRTRPHFSELNKKLIDRNHNAIVLEGCGNRVCYQTENIWLSRCKKLIDIALASPPVFSERAKTSTPGSSIKELHHAC